MLQLYESEERLTGVTGGHLAAGLLAGEGAVVIATAEHRAAFAATMSAWGVDVADAAASGRLVMRDAERTLKWIMTPQGPDPVRMAATVGAMLDTAGAGGRPLRFYGEMLALLWRDGHVGSAMELERMGNRMAAEFGCSMLCGYPRALFDDAPDGTLEQLRELHTGEAHPAPSAPPATVPRRRTLGPCAHCHEPVSQSEPYVRLYRRAWHLECALDSDDPGR